MVYRLNPGDPPPPQRQANQRGARRRRAARRTVAVIPTLFTLGNLLSGFMAIFFASRTSSAGLPFQQWTALTFAAVFIFVGMVMDALDGRIARMTRSTSDMGVQLDSMADMVTFGVAPAFIAVQLIGINTPFLGDASRDLTFDRVALVIAAIYVACTALRLARFNLEIHRPTEADHSSFKGLPSPGAAGTVASLVLLHQHFLVHEEPNYWSIRVSAVAMVMVMLLVAFAMVSRIRYVHLVNRYLRGRVGIRKIALIVIVGLAMAVRLQASLAFVFTAYALSAPLTSLFRLITGKPAATTVVAPGTAGGAKLLGVPESPIPGNAPESERRTG